MIAPIEAVSKRKIRLLVFVTGVTISVAVLLCVAVAQEPVRAQTVPEGHPIALGATIHDYPSYPLNPTGLDEYTALTAGEKPAIANWFQSWDRYNARSNGDLGLANGVIRPEPVSGFANSTFLEEQFDLVYEDDITPMLTWYPEDAAKDCIGQPPGCRADQPKYGLDKIIAGEWDDHIGQTARAMRDWNDPIYLRFALEMNGDWFAWSNGVNGNDEVLDQDPGETIGDSPGEKSDDFIQAWRHVHYIFRQEGATNVRWVWSPSIKELHKNPREYRAFYPGDDVVDWIALDGYNWGTDSTHAWMSFKDVFSNSSFDPNEFDNSYKEIVDLTNKPMMLAETASSEPLTADTGYPERNKGEWIKQAFLDDINNAPNPNSLSKLFPRIQAVVWFHQDYDNRQWQIDSSTGSKEAYKAVVTSSRYAGSMPTLAVPIIGEAPPGASNSRSATLGFSSPEPGVGFECALDDSSFAACFTPKTYTGLSDGYHTFRVRAADGSGNVSGRAEYIWEVRTGMVDATAPTINSVTPTDDARQVGRGTNVMATFSEAMNPSTINPSTFKLYKCSVSGGSSCGGTYSVEVQGGVRYALNTVTLDPNERLGAGRWYKAVVTTGAKDTAGNALAVQKEWTFKTRN